MTHVGIVYHSGFGHTKVLAQHIAQGAAQEPGIDASLFNVEDLTDDLEPLNAMGALIFGSPTYMGSVSGPFKSFMDTSSKLWFQRAWKDKVAAGFTNSHSMSGDKLNTLVQLSIFASQHGMIWVSQAEMNGSPDGQPGQSDAINRMGSTLGLMAQSENASPEVTPPEGDLKTAQIFGQRVAQVAALLKANQR